MEKRKKFGEYIRSIRLERGLSQQKVSENLGYKTLGVLHGVERGISPLPIDKIHPLAKVYKIDVEEMLDQLKDCEPELYEKYMTLEKDFSEYLLHQVKNFTRSKTVRRLAGLSLIIYKMSTKNPVDQNAQVFEGISR